MDDGEDRGNRAKVKAEAIVGVGVEVGRRGLTGSTYTHFIQGINLNWIKNKLIRSLIKNVKEWELNKYEQHAVEFK